MEKLKSLRKAQKLTQEDVGKHLGITGQSYSNYENNNREPDFATISKLADYFNVSVDYLLDRTDEPNYISTESDYSASYKLAPLTKRFDEALRPKLEKMTEAELEEFMKTAQIIADGLTARDNSGIDNIRRDIGMGNEFKSSGSCLSDNKRK